MAKFNGGMGGANMQSLMKQAQKMQEEMQATEKLLDEWESVGTAGGEAVGIEIDKSVIDPEDEEMLEDLIMAAILDGYKKADAVYQEKMGKFGGMGGMGGML